MKTSTVKKFIRSVRTDAKLAGRVNFQPGGGLRRDNLAGSRYMPAAAVAVKKGVLPAGVVVARRPDGIEKGISRRAAAIHEIGHAMDDGVQKIGTRWDNLKMRLRGLKSNGKAIVERERVANRNAIARMRKVGAGEDEVRAYRQAVKPGFNSYRSQFINPLFPALRSNPNAVSTARRQKQIPSSNGHNFPLAFVKDSKAKFNAICRLGNPLPFNLKLQLSASSLDPGFEVQPKELQGAPEKPLTLQTGEVETNAAFGDEITLYCDIPPANEGFFIDWKLGFAGQAPIALQRTVHTLYLTAKVPVQPMAHGLRESLFFYACDANAGEESTDARVLLEAIHWEVFSTKEMRAVVPGLAKIDRDSEVFKFRLGESGYIPDSKSNVCGGWAEFMRDTAWVHGAGEVQVVPVRVNTAADVPGPHGNYKVQKWYVPPRTVTQGENPPQPENPTPDGGQGNGHTSAEWNGHVIVGFLDGQTATGPFYDPSYGTPKANPGAAPDVFNALEDYARLAAAGFYGSREVPGAPTQHYYWKEEHLQNVQEIVIQGFTTQPPPPQPQP